ncbi:sensor histidine kinase [Allobaculum stercoricanis]|uniref:sensor histidine kinase n=1 Tax=Allobaculum stercoricanis TaxID=174709 RepID=UPI00035E66B9|nr:ATP-binding protein [Allobaculum stercoricanis]
MTSKILRSILSVATVVLISSMLVVTGFLYSYFDGVQQTQLKTELNLAAKATEQLGIDYLESLNTDQYRLTWVAPDGTVIFDSEADPATMENHANREEIIEARTYDFGSSTRESSTMMEQTVYEAKSLEDGSVLRISINRATKLMLILGLLQPIGILLIVAIAVSALLARRMAKRVVEPLNNLNLEEPLENEAYEELSPLLHRIHSQQNKIEDQMHILKQKQDEFEQITDNMNEALVLLDRSDRILSINPSARRLFEVQEDCIGQDFLSVDRKQNIREALAQTKTTGHADFCSEIHGKDYQFDLSRIESEGRFLGTVLLAFDVTEQLHAQKQRQEFTANVSHELKTPLQSIIGSAELMENGVVKPEDVPRFVGHIRKEASRLVILIDDIIRLSQLDEQADMPHEDVSLKELATEVCETLSDAAKIKDVALNVEGDLGIIYGVRQLLYEVIYNLCDNAIKYNEKGGKVNIAIHQTPNAVQLKIQDTGIGIPYEHQEKVFNRFYRVDKSHSKQSGGTGLGLSIVKHAVQYHHGKIELDSEPNEGTTITITFDTQVHPL